MFKRVTPVLVLASVLLGGCVTAPQMPVSLTPDRLSASSGRVGVAMNILPKADVQILGAGCLLCYGTAVAANAALTEHAGTLPPEGLSNLKDDILNLLRKRGTDAMVISEPIDMKKLSSYDKEGPNVARTDFTPLKKKYSIDKLLLIEVSELGFMRTYAQYFPTSDPKASFKGTGSLVNLKDNTYEWYMPVSILKSADKNWDEPPKFPGLTNAYFQVLELAQDAYKGPLRN